MDYLRNLSWYSFKIFSSYSIRILSRFFLILAVEIPKVFCSEILSWTSPEMFNIFYLKKIVWIASEIRSKIYVESLSGSPPDIHLETFSEIFGMISLENFLGFSRNTSRDYPDYPPEFLYIFLRTFRFFSRGSTHIFLEHF